MIALYKFRINWSAIRASIMTSQCRYIHDDSFDTDIGLPEFTVLLSLNGRNMLIKLSSKNLNTYY